MNLGELNAVFNSQTQLNNDWFIPENKEDKSFQNILESKTQQRSDVRETKPKVQEKTKVNKQDPVKKNNDLSTKEKVDHSKDLDHVKSELKKAIAKNKYEKEVAKDGNVSKEELKEQIEALEEAIKEELGLTEEPEVMAMMAALLGISVEQLTEQLTGTEVDEALVNEIVALIESEEVDSKDIVTMLEQVSDKISSEDMIQFEQAVKKIISQLSEGENKETIVAFEEVLDQLIVETSHEKAPVEMVQQEQASVESKVETQTVVTQTVEAEQPMEVKEVTTDSEQPKEQSSTNKEAVPMMNAEIKQVKNETGQKFSIEDQIGMMKTESSSVVAVKETPKMVLAKSIMNQVVQGTKMSINMSDQGSEILIKLNPKNLGNVSLKMAFDKGEVMAQIQVENQTVKGIIESNLDDLRSALREEGYEVGDLDVSVNKEDTGEKNEKGFSGGKKQFVKHESFEEVEEKIMRQKLQKEGFDYLA